MKDGFVKTAAGTPDIKVADCGYNCARIKALIDKAHEQGVRVLVLPELCITGYTCQDLFFQQTLLDGALNALKDITEHSAGLDMLIAVGCPLRFRGELYNCAVVMKDGKILGVVPKKFLPNYNEFYEKRHFTAAPEGEYDIELFGESVPFGLGLLFECRGTPELVFAAEICEDLWAAEPPSISLALGGATLIANLSASNETIGKDSYRRELVNSQSARLLCGYVYASAGSGESTQDLVFGGHDIIAENGIVLAESKLYSTGLTVTEIDVQKLASERRRNTSFVGGLRPGMRRIPFDMEIKPAELTRIVRRTPFVPNTSAETDKRCEDILTMQAHGLEKRVRHTDAKTLVIGISGGLDSTLALLVCVEAMKLLGRPASDILAVTMPCFGTTKRTRSNAERLCELLGTRLRVIDIADSVKQHFKDIGHDESNHNVVYENGQARERTKILMDLANAENGMVIGTGDLSELALGWATYNGDHMSMYGVNCGIPKTLVRHLVGWVAAKGPDEAARPWLLDILDTPISPELLPADGNGQIAQCTEELVGPYDLHDFFLYYFVRFGFRPAKLYLMARQAFAGKYEDRTIKRWLITFLRRFFSQQFKRSALPDGPKVGSVSLSPRGDWRMPSDASCTMWLHEAENL